MVQEKLSRPSKPLLDTFYNLSCYNDGVRDEAALNLLQLQKSEDASSYCLERLVKGLASPREASRLGFSIALTELLRSNESILCDDVFTLMDKHLPLTGAGENGKDNSIGQILCTMALIRSKKCIQALEKTVEKLDTLQADRPYLELTYAQAVISLSLLVDDESFKTIIWPSIKKHYNFGLDACTPSSMWVLLELEKSHSKFLRKRAKLFRGDDWPPTSAEQFQRIGEIVAAGARSSPSGIHPLEKCLLLTMMAGDHFPDFWNHTICGCLMKNEDKLVSPAGIRAIGDALSMQPSKKQLKSILSQDTLKLLLKSVLDRSPASRFSKSAAWNQIAAIQDNVASNKANPAVQFFVLKNLLGVSINFDGVTSSTTVHGIIGELSGEAASLITDDLISKLKDDSELQSSDIIIIIKLLNRLFECSRYATKESVDYRPRILTTLANAAFMKADSTSSSVKVSEHSETATNAFMRCLSSLCVITTFQRSRGPKFEFPQDSALLMADLIDLVTEKKSCQLSDKCKVTLKPDHKELIMKSSKAFRQLLKSVKALESSGDTGTSEIKGFFILIGYVLFWFLSSPDTYSRSLADLLVCCEKCQKKEAAKLGGSWEDVLIDLLMSLLSLPHRHIRTPLQVAFHYFCSHFNSDNIRPLLQALRPSEQDTLAVDDDEDMEDDEELDENGAETSTDKQQSEESDADSSLDEEEPIVEDDTSDHVDPEFRRAVQEALGDAADDSDTASVASDLSDEAMMNLDKALAGVFRAHLQRSQSKKSARDLAEQAQAFRIRCFDLLYVLIHSNPSVELLTGILIPLLNVASESAKASDQKMVFNRSSQVLERVTQIKDTSAPETPSEFMTSLCQTIKELFEFTRTNGSNPSIGNLASDCLRFALKLSDGVKNEAVVKQFQKEVNNIVSSNLTDYLKDRLCLLPTSIFVAAFQKRPEMFMDNLRLLVDAAFDRGIRPFRRHEACTLINCLLNKNALTVLKEQGDKKFLSTWKGFVDRLHGGIFDLIKDLPAENQTTMDDEEEKEKKKEKKEKEQNEKEKETKEKEKENKNKKKKSKKNGDDSSPPVSPGDIFEALIVLRSVANLRDVVPSLRHLEEEEFIQQLGKLSTTSKVGKKQRKIGQGQRHVRLSKLSSEVMKKLRSSTVPGDHEEKKRDGDDEEQKKKKRDIDEEQKKKEKGEEDEGNASQPSPKRKRKSIG